MEQEPGLEHSAGRTWLPWLVAGAAFVLYLVTLNHWISLGNRIAVERAYGWVWQPDLLNPLFWLVTCPFRWLPAAKIPLALNAFSALCAGLTLAQLARSVMLLPHDRTHGQRLKEQSDFSLLSIRTAWLPPIFAVIVCGLQLTFWEHATAASAEMFDLLLFSFIIRCVLEFRLTERESWLTWAALVYGVSIPENWAMIGFLPLFIMALIWIRGLSFFNLRFLGRMLLCGGAGLLLYLLLPLVQSRSDVNPVPFFEGLTTNLKIQKYMLGGLYKYQRTTIAMMGLTSLLPVFIISIKWASYFGDTSKLGIMMANFVFHIVHGFFLVACIWVALDPPFSPRNRGFGLPFLTFYYLGALAIGYCSGYLLLIFSKPKPDRLRRTPEYVVFFNLGARAAVFLLFAATPIVLGARSWPQLRLTNGNLLHKFAADMAAALPEGPTLVLSDDGFRLTLAEAAARQAGRARGAMFVDTSSLRAPAYHRLLAERYPKRWTSNPPKKLQSVAESWYLQSIVTQLAQSNTVYYLHPSFGYYFEGFYLEPHGLVYRLDPYATNALFPPTPSEATLQENTAFWRDCKASTLDPLAKAVKPWAGMRNSVIRDVFDLAHLESEPNRVVTLLANSYSRALTYWGAALHKLDRTNEAIAQLETAMALNPDNVVAQINLEYYQNPQSVRDPANLISKSIEDRFSRYRGWDQILGENGPFDEPYFCYEQARELVRNSLWRQALQEFSRVLSLQPNDAGLRRDTLLWQAQLYVMLYRPEEALKIVSDIHTHAKELDLGRDKQAELLSVEGSAYLLKEDPQRAAQIFEAAVRKYPDDTRLSGTAVQVFFNFGQYTNAIKMLDLQLQLAPDDQAALINKAVASIRITNNEVAVSCLNRVLTQDPTNTAALFNRGIAFSRCGKPDEALQDFKTLEASYPKSPDLQFRLGEVYYQKKDTNNAVRYYESYLLAAPTNTPVAELVRTHLKELKPGRG
jgi:tetratricopeptide (TPR) repeat protein